MKKNILAIIILAATIINLTLTAVMVFVVVPNAKRTDTLITKVLQMIDLDLQSPVVSDVVNNSKPSVTDTDVYPLSSPLTIQLTRTLEDKKDRYVKTEVSLSMNKKASDYKDLKEQVEPQENYIRGFIEEEVRKYTADNLYDNKDQIKAAVLEKIKVHFNSDFIFDISLTFTV